MKLIGYEFYKIITKKMIVLLIIPLLLMANGGLYFKEQLNENAYLIDNIQAYYMFEQNYKERSAEQAAKQLEELVYELGIYSTLLYAASGQENPALKSQLEAIKQNTPELIDKFSNSVYASNAELLKQEFYFSTLVYSQYTAIREYRSYVGEMQKRADEMLSVSIFQEEGTFSYRNIVKTPKDFQHLQSIALNIGLDNGIVSSSHMPITDMLLTVIIFLLGYYLFLHEKETGIIRLIRTNKKGRYPVIAAKLIVLAAMTTLLAIIFYGSIWMIAYQLYGFGDMSRYIQSIAAFRNSHLLITVSEYLWLFMLGKVVVCVWVSMIFAVFFIRLDHASKIYSSILLLFGLSYYGFVAIHPLSLFNLMKYVNIFSFYDVFALLGVYRNINFWGYPIPNISVSIIAIFVTLVIFIVMAMLMYAKHYTVNPQTLLPNLWNQVKQKWFRIQGSIHVLNHEMYKAFFTGKGIIILVLAAIIGLNQLNFDEIRFDEDDAIYNQYLDKLSGELDQDKIAYMQEEKRQFEQLPSRQDNIRQAYEKGEISTAEYTEKLSELEIFNLKREAFIKLEKQYHHLEKLRQETGINGSFVNELASDYLFNNRFKDMLNSLLYTLLLLICLCNLFPMDYKNGIIAVLRCTKKGRFTLFAYKYLIGYMTAVFIMGMIYLPSYFNLVKGYNFNHWHAPIQSIEIFRSVNIPISIWEFVILVGMLQLLGSIIVTHCALALSLMVRKQALSLIVTSIIFVIPIIIQFAGVDFIRTYSFNNVFCLFTDFAASGLIQHTALYYGALLVIAICSGLAAWNRYNNNLFLWRVKKR